MSATVNRSGRRLSTSLFMLALAAAGGAGALAIAQSTGTKAATKGETDKSTSIEQSGTWAAAAPGRIEPKSGLVRVSAQILGRIAEVAVKLNDRVEEGELLLRLDDEEARARLQAAETEAASRKRERDAQPVDKAREDVRKSEDAVFSAERTVTNARFELEYELQARRTGGSNRVTEARKSLQQARDKLQKERSAYASAQAKSDVPAPSRLESALQASRSDVAVAEALLEKTRVRAPVSGTVLQLPAKAGEMVAPSPDQIVAVVGDMSVVRVKAEVDEQDVAKIKVGGRVIVKSNAYPGREFTGRVSELAPTLGSPSFALRGARRPTDVEVLEVTIDLEGSVPLLPGMRADAFFTKD